MENSEEKKTPAHTCKLRDNIWVLPPINNPYYGTVYTFHTTAVFVFYQ
jgi:hypothetical protein